MSYFEAALYGVVQGLSEYLPISSSAHLVLLPQWLGTSDPGLAFDVFVHVGTLAATIVYFRKEWLAMFQNRALFFKICVATAPALLIGALMHGWIATHARGTLVLASTLSLFGILLWAVDRYAAGKKYLKPLKNIDTQSALKIGLAQVWALIPGVSRSGITMTMARGLGFSREAAAKFSFLLSAPVTGAALVFEMRDIHKLTESQLGFDVLAIAALSAFVSGWLAIAWLLKLIRKRGYAVFAIYRVVLAGVILAFLL